MFMKKVVKYERVMKKEVEVMMKLMEEEKRINGGEGRKSEGKVMMEKVKGDVKDIGKNIVGVVME